MSDIYDAVILGSGPAGVSVAFPLAEAGLNIAVVKGRSPGAWLACTSLSPHKKNLSPKLSEPETAADIAAYSSFYNLRPRNFEVAGSLRPGGLSRVWGGGVARFSPEDTAQWPVDRAELEEAYDAVEKRVDICGAPAPHPRRCAVFAHSPEISAATRRVLNKCATSEAADFFLNEAQHAMDYPRIYNAEWELERLSHFPNVTIVEGLAQEIAKEDGGWQARCVADTEFTLRGTRLLLACGTLGSAILAAKFLRYHGRAIPFASHPAAAFALWAPVWPDLSGMSDFFFGAEATYAVKGAYGNLFNGKILSASMLKDNMGVPTVLIPLLRPFLNGLLVANLFLDSRYSAHSLTLNRDDSIALEGTESPECAAHLQEVMDALRRNFTRCGARPVPRSLRRAAVGGDVHYAGTLPMGGDGEFSLTPGGELCGQANLFVVDGAALPSLPCAPPTLTIMANAQRIGRRIATARKNEPHA